MPVTIELISTKLQALIAASPIATGMISIYASCINAYNTKVLNELKVIMENETDSAELVLKWQAFLNKNWELIKGTGLGYTAQPGSPVTDLLCDIASFVAQKTNTNILNVLMPTVCVESIDWRYPDLEPANEVATKAILRTHIQGQEGKYLIPIKCLAVYDIQSGFKRIYNPYYDIDTHSETMVYLQSEEVNRLVEHSRFTREVHDAQQAFEGCANDQETLLGQLRLLVNHLGYSSKNGVGTETAAGTASATAIFNFMEYYDRLGEESLAEVPQELKTQIQSLREYSSNQGLNTTYLSCMALRRSNLVSSMSLYLGTLERIKISHQTRRSLVAVAKTRLDQARSNLLESFTQENAGFDKAVIPHELIEHFDARVVFNTYSDIEVFKFFSAEQIEAFCGDCNYQDSILKAIGSLENLVLLSHQLSPERLASLLRALEPALSLKYFLYSKDFLSVIMSLDQVHRDVYWQQYKTKLPTILCSSKGGILSILEALLGIHTRFEEVSSVFSLLTEPQQSELYEIMRPLWSQKLTSAFELADAIKNFKPEWRSEVFHLFRDAQVAQVKSDDVLSKSQIVRLYASLEQKLYVMNSTDVIFQSELRWAYISELAKIAALPGIKKYGFSRYESSSAFFKTLAVPGLGFGFTLLAVIPVVTETIRGIYKLLRGEFQAGAESIAFAALALCVTAILAALTLLVTAVTIPSVAIRSTVTAGSYLLGGYAEPKLAEDGDSSLRSHAAAMP